MLRRWISYFSPQKIDWSTILFIAISMLACKIGLSCFGLCNYLSWMLYWVESTVHWIPQNTTCKDHYTTKKIMSSLKTAKWCHFHLHILHKAAKSMAKLISQLCGKSQLAVCLSRGYAAILRRPKHLWMSERPQKQATAKAAWETFNINTCLNF